jgi:hypothetical protein
MESQPGNNSQTSTLLLVNTNLGVFRPISVISLFGLVLSILVNLLLLGLIIIA